MRMPPRPLTALRCALAAMLVLGCSVASAARWVKVADYDDETFFLDAASRSRANDVTKASVLVNYKSVHEIDGVRARSTVVDFEFDCKTSSVTTHRADVFEQPMGKGRKLLSLNETTSREAKVPPLTRLRAAACARER